MVFLFNEWLVLLTLVLIVYWGISLYTETYKPFLITTVLLLFFGLLWFLTTPAEKAVLFGFPASVVMSSLGYISLGIGAIGSIIISKDKEEHYGLEKRISG